MSVIGTAALVSSIPSILKAGTGIWQMIKGGGAINNRPEMPVPDSVNQMISLLTRNANQSRMPGQDVIEGNIRGSTATGIEGMQDASAGGEGLGAIAQMIASQQDQFSNLGAQGAQMKRQAENTLASGLGQKGQYEQAAWEWNEKGKYDEAMALFGSGMQNVMGGVSEGAKTGTLGVLAGNKDVQNAVGGMDSEQFGSLLKALGPLLGAGSSK